MKNNDQKINVCLIENNKIIRKGWKIILESAPDFDKIQSFEYLHDAIQSGNLLNAKLIVSNFNEGINSIRTLINRYPIQNHIIYTRHDDDPDIFAAILAGAVSFITRSTSPDEFLRTMRDSANGRSPMTPSVAVRLKTLLSPENKTDFIVAKEITSFEMRIIECIAEGKSYQASARELSIGIDEVTASIRNIYLKIQGKLNANK